MSARNPITQGNPRTQVGDSVRKLRSLRRRYTIAVKGQTILEILNEDPAIYPLLIEAGSAFDRAFGSGRTLRLRALTSDDERLVKVAVQLPSEIEAGAEKALHQFDSDWWLNNCHLSGGALVFDYEILDAV